MALNQVMKTFAESIGLKADENFAYGVFNDYFMTVFNTSYNKAVFINFAKPDIVSDDEEVSENNGTHPDDAEKADAAVSEECACPDGGETGSAEKNDIEEAASEEAEAISYDGGEAEGESDGEKEDGAGAEDVEDKEDEEDEDDGGEGADSVSDFAFSSGLQNILRDYDIVSDEIDDNGVFIETSSSLVKFREIIEKVTALLKEHGYAGRTHCSSCGKKFCSGDARRVYKDKFNYLVCSECADELIEEQEIENEKIAMDLSGGSTGKAVGWALLSSFVLSAVMVVLYKYLLPAVPVWGNLLPGYFACLIPFVMAAFNMTLYKKAAKKAGVKRILVSLIIALVFTAVTQYACSVILFVRSGAQTLAEAKAGVSPLTATQLANAASEILKTPLLHDTEWYMLYKYLVIDGIMIAAGIFAFSFSTVKQPDKSLTVIPYGD